MLPQLIPVGVDVTVPDPVPAFDTPTVNVGIAFTVNVKLDDLFATPEDTLEIPTAVEATVADVVAEYVNATVHDPDVGVQDCELAEVNDTPAGSVPTATVTACAVP